MKRFISFFLVLSFLFGTAAVYTGAEGVSIKYVKCYSNLSNINEMEILKCGEDSYISEEDLATVSGFISTGIMSFARKGTKGEHAFVDTNHVKIEDAIDYEGKMWAPLESSCEKLQTQVSVIGDYLVFNGKETTPEELISMTDDWLLGSSFAEIIDTHNWKGNLGLFGAFMIDVALDWKEVGKRIFGIHKKEIYKEIFADLVSNESASYGGLESAQKLNKALNTMSSYLLATEYDMAPADVCNLMYKLGIADDAAVTYKVTEGVKTVLDPLDTLYSEVVKSDLFKGSVLKDVKLDGLDIITQLELYSNLDAIINSTETSANMIKYTFYSPGNGKLVGGLNSEEKNEITKIVDYHNTTDYYKGIALAFSEEVETVAGETIGATFSDVLFDLLTDSDIGFRLAVKAYQLALKTLFDEYLDKAFGFKPTKGADYVENARVLNDLQSLTIQLYNEYRCTPDTAINAKYASIFYLKCAALNDKYLATTEDNGMESGLYYGYISDLISVSDYDLTNKVKNEKVVVPGRTIENRAESVTVSDAVNYSKKVVPIYEGSVSEDWEHSVIIPKIDKDLPGAEAINEKIYDKFYPYCQVLKDGEEKSYLCWISYDYSVYDGILVIQITHGYGWQASEGYTDYYEYMYDIEGDKELSIGEALSAWNLKEESLREKINQSKEVLDLKAGRLMISDQIKDYDSYTIEGLFINKTGDVNIDIKYTYPLKIDGEKYDENVQFLINISMADLESLRNLK